MRNRLCALTIILAIILLFISMTPGLAEDQKQPGFAQTVKQLLIQFHRYYYLKQAGIFADDYFECLRTYQRLSYELAKTVNNYLNEGQPVLYDGFVTYVRNRMELTGSAFSQVLRYLKEALTLRLNNPDRQEPRLDREEVLKRLAVIDNLLSESFASSPVKRKEWKRHSRTDDNSHERNGSNFGIPYSSPEPCPPGYGQSFEDVRRIRVPGAEYLAIHFQRMNLEQEDEIKLFDGAGNEVIAYKPDHDIPAYRYTFSGTRHQPGIKQAQMDQNLEYPKGRGIKPQGIEKEVPVKHISWSEREGGFWSPRIEGDLIHVVILNGNQTATESGYTVDNTLRFDTNARYSDLAAHYAPWLYQETVPGAEQQEYITAINYDGDWQGRNNWENLLAVNDQNEKKFAFYNDYLNEAVLYWWVVETETDYYIGYADFHPRDWCQWFDIWNNGFYDFRQHENDMEGLLLVVAKDGTRYGEPIVMVTQAHHFFWQYSNYNFLPEHDDIDNALLLQEGHHPRVFVQDKGHGIYGSTSEGFFFGGSAEYDGENGHGHTYTHRDYSLRSMTPLWNYRFNEGIGDDLLFVPFFPDRFIGDTHTPNAASAPWGWWDWFYGVTLKGQIFTDPPAFIDYQLKIPGLSKKIIGRSYPLE